MSGASGGSGVYNKRDESKGAYAHAQFNLTEGERIYLLIGQAGADACAQVRLARAQVMPALCSREASPVLR